MNTSTEFYDPYPFEEFAPTLSQCFVIVIVGYLLARLNLLTAGDVKGVIAFASYFAMPGIICMSLAEADFHDFRWELLTGIFLGKLISFMVVAGFLLFLDGNMGVAGIVALFCAQSNDLPVGNPLMSSLYKENRPEMMKYLFLIPALTLILVVPISNVMVRLYRNERKANKKNEEHPTFKDYLRQYLRDKEKFNDIIATIKNPVVIATMLGLILNAVFQSNVPRTLHKPIQVTAQTIPGIALAMLGFSFVRKERFLISSAVIPAAVLLIIKMVLTPVLLHAILKMLTDELSSSKLLSDFALLYGIISPATAAFQIGQEFRKPLAAMSVALILSSFSCFPVSYVVAHLTIAPVHPLTTYVPLLKKILFWTACMSILCDVTVCIVILWKRHWSRISSCYTLYLVFTQIITCAGLLIWTLTEDETWAVYSQMALYFCGEISGYLWTGMLAVLLALRNKYFLLEENGFAIMSFTAFSVSAGITVIMYILMSGSDQKEVYIVDLPKSSVQFLQLIVTTITLFTSLVVVAASLIQHFREKKPQKKSAETFAYENSVVYILEQEELSVDCQKELVISQKSEQKSWESEEAKVYYDEVKKNSEEQNYEPSERREWTFHLSSLLILQGLVMLVRFITNLYKLTDSKCLEVVIPLEFLQSTLFIGQGTFILLTLGVDVRTAVISLRKWWRKRRKGKDEISVDFTNCDQEGEAAQFCSQFDNFYYSQCFRDIAKERRWRGVIYEDSFWGHQLVDWMFTEGLCHDDADAEGKGQKLLAGKVIRHVTDRHNFYDGPYLYCFVRKNKSSGS